MIGWIETHPHAAQSIGVVLAASIALLAAIIAYFGATKQAKAARFQAEMSSEIAEKARLREVKLTATAIAAEIKYWTVIMVSVRSQALEKRTIALYRLSKKRLRVPVFDKNPRDLAVLDPYAVADIIAFYNSLDEHVEVVIDGLEHIRKNPDDEKSFGQIAELSEMLIIMGSNAVERLQQAAEIEAVRLPSEAEKAIKEIRLIRDKVKI
ncbi:hypothetical protein [Thalassospira sp.]|uniref:hypothetical protein n=1 Tax=Thalassospira sp. TaxID=1912094 RepID=UPI0027351D9C|nr:hypothetical protein [Thalassospira sp.]MDP2697633.1 hypothetical protein [Thalassospira sp.]